ncbi:hypothetical protein [Kitasatospora sp. NPDC004531]
MDAEFGVRGRRGSGVVAVVAALVVCGLLVGLYFANRSEDRAAPEPVPSVSASSGAPATPAATGPAPERIVLERAPQGELQVIDLDLPSGRSQRITGADPDRAHVDLLMTDASTAEYEIPSGGGRSAGALAPFGPVTQETCLRAARTGTLTRFRVGTADRSSLASQDIQRGSSICVVTDQRQLVQLTVTDQTFDNAQINTTGRLTVTVTVLGPAGS